MREDEEDRCETKEGNPRGKPSGDRDLLARTVASPEAHKRRDMGLDM